MVQEADHPVIIAGSGAWYSDAGDELEKLIDKSGMPLFTSLAGRGVVSDNHPLCFESAVPVRPGCVFTADFEADLIILLGARVCYYYLSGDIFNPAAKLVQVDIEPEEIGRNRSVDLPVASDVKGFLKACNQSLLMIKISQRS